MNYYSKVMKIHGKTLKCAIRRMSKEKNAIFKDKTDTDTDKDAMEKYDNLCSRIIDEEFEEEFKNTIQYSYNEISEIKDIDDDDNCAICTKCIKPENGDDYNEKTITKIQCEHIFHTLCIMEWIKIYSDTCPLCRKTCNNK
uniref:Ring finger protein n=1 Tax=Mimivirus LCMiAC02 TaxID=2506609 RepID=A0A4P6VPD5_9VIRU|nr:MAG: ring finger protein [Mimivirus LCMiAC02]